MPARNSIHKSGELAITRLSALLQADEHAIEKGVRSGRNAKTQADVTFIPAKTTNRIPIEVKKASSSVSQLRPAAYKVTVVYSAAESGAPERWWVLPPDDLVRLALKHPGQHCLSSFECMNPGKPSQAWDQWLCKASNLAAAIQAAHTQGIDSPIASIAERIRSEIAKLYACHKQLVAESNPKRNTGG